jgi:Predicted membrane protein (DUF2306)
MSEIILPQVASNTPLRNKRADTALKGLAAYWLIVTVIGQSAFMFSIAVFYAAPALQGNFASWAKNKMLIKGYVAGDFIGNLIFSIHVALAAIVVFGGILQLIPQIRAYAPRFHRWNGRLFMSSLLIVCVVGLNLTWVRGTYLNTLGAFAISLNAVLIMVFATLAWRAIRAGDIASHRAWALRTFMVASGVWFMRVGYFGWILIHQAPVGMGEKMDGPFDIFMAFGCYLLPLAVLELYLRAKNDPRPMMKFATASALFLFTTVMALGIAGVSFILWWPLLLKM